MLEGFFPEWLLNFSNFAVITGASILVQSTIIIALGLCIAYFLRNKGAAIQSVVLRAFLAAVLLSPVVSIFIDTADMSGVKFEVPLVFFKHSETTSYPVKTEHGNIVMVNKPLHVSK